LYLATYPTCNSAVATCAATYVYSRTAVPSDQATFHVSGIEVMLIKSRRMRWAEHVTLMEEMRNAHKILVEKHEGTPDIVRVIKSRRMRRVGHVARIGERRVVYRDLVGRPKGKRPLGRARRR